MKPFPIFNFSNYNFEKKKEKKNIYIYIYIYNETFVKELHTCNITSNCLYKVWPNGIWNKNIFLLF